MNDEDLRSMFELDRLPLHMVDGVVLWIRHGVMTGSFQTAVFENKFVDAFAQADETNLFYMKKWAQWLYNNAPAGCWGSEEKVKIWREHGGLSGLQARLDTEAARQVHREEPLEDGEGD